MDGNTSGYNSITPSTESEIISEGAVITEENISINDTNLEVVQADVETSSQCVEVNSNITNTKEQDILSNETGNVLINEIESVPITTTNVSINNSEKPIVSSCPEEQETMDTPTDVSLNYIEGSINSATNTENNEVNQHTDTQKTAVEINLTDNVDFEDLTQSPKDNIEAKCSVMGPNLEDSENIESSSGTNSQELIESNLNDPIQNNCNTSEGQITETEKANAEDGKCSDLTINIEQDDKLEYNNIRLQQARDEGGLVSNETIKEIINDNDGEVILNSDQPIQPIVDLDHNISKDMPKPLKQKETVEEQVQSIHDPIVEGENSEQDLIDEEISNITHEAVGESKKTNVDMEQRNSTEENIETNSAIEQIDISIVNENNNDNEDQIIGESIGADEDNIEKQVSNIVQEEEQEVSKKAEKTMSIVEAIQRDFDETDSEEVDKPDIVEESRLGVARDHVVVGVNISDQLQHGPVTVTDTTGQVYYVQSVEDLIVVENDELSATLDQPETLEVTVLSEVEEPAQQQTNPTKIKERPPIPSHILGRNIENPVIDTFRNGKVPPKPRLGVKIPYKNLTSQIVTKDELAKEILDRQKQKYKQTGQTTREVLFTNKLTHRLAKKIVPTTTSKTSTTVVEKNTDEAINNSDLLAILEGDGDDTKLACTSKPNVSGFIENKKDPNLQIKKEKTDGKPPMSKLTEREIALKQLREVSNDGKMSMSKLTEREIALKQLREVSTGFCKRKWVPMKVAMKKSRNEPEVQLTEVNEVTSEAPTMNSSTEIEKKEIKKVVQSQLDNQPEEMISKLGEPESNINHSSSLENSSVTNSEVKASSMTKLESTVVKKLEVKSDKVKELVPHVMTKPETTKIETKKKEIKEQISNEPSKSETENTSQKVEINDIKQLPSEVEKLSTDTESKSMVTPIKPTTATVKTKPDELNVLVGDKVNDNVKKADTAAKPITAKIADSTKILNKIDPILVDGKDEFIERKHISNPPVKTYTRKRKSTEDSSVLSNVPDKKPTIIQKDTSIPPNTYITKSSRIIKRKVIWDPDEPSTARSLAARFSKPDPVKSEKTVKSEINLSKMEKKPVVKSVVKAEIIKSPIRSADIQKTKKRLSEIDKLLMDEGAVNMLYAFKNVDDAIKKKKSSVISIDKAQRELMNKTNEIKKDLKTNSDKVSPKSLRRKDSPVPSPSKKIIPASVSRKKSKDSNRSSLHSPPASPGMIFSNHAEASRIIRRHSSSSYSSMEGDFDVDKKIDTEVQTITSTDSEKGNKKRVASVGVESNKIKKSKRTMDKENPTVVEKGKANEETTKTFNRLVEGGQASKESKYHKYKTFSVKEINHMVQIILLPSFNNEAYLTPEILNELCSIIKELQEDKNCRVVVISSSASSFCNGINYKTLLSDKEQSRRTFAKKLALCVTNFLRILASFTKILVAGVHGDTVGLGVTILPLFDMVIASDTATFSIPNARLGCAAEGGSLLSLPHLMHNVLVSELLYASRKLIAAEALRLGMVTRVLWPDKFQQELVSIVKTISNHSPQFMELTKKQLRQHMIAHIESVLDKEVDTLIQHWTSSECQKNFGVYG